MGKRNRYPGTTSFTTQEETVFFGRNDDIRQLLTSVLVNPTTVLFGNSGTGKSSIIRAGLMPELVRKFADEDDVRDRYLTIDIDPKGWTPDRHLLDEVKRIIRAGLNLTVELISRSNGEPDDSLWYLLKQHQYNQVLLGESQNILFVFDQAENIFTYPDREIEAFIHELEPIVRQYIPEYFRYRLREKGSSSSADASAIFHSALPVKFLFAIRSDKLHLVTRLKKASPLILQNSYELLPLSRAQAFAAIMRPANAPGDFATEPFSVTEAAAASIFFQLSGVNTASSEGLDDARIDPFGLQIVCSFIEEKLLPGQHPRVITDTELPDLKKVINGYYEESIQSLPIPESDKDFVRDFIETKMIANNRRIPLADVMITGDPQNHMSQQVLDQLVARKILKTDIIPGGAMSMYEITHDSFIHPIMEGRSQRLSTVLTAAEQLNNAINDLRKTIDDKWAVYRRKEADTKLVKSSRREELNKKAEIIETTIPESARQDADLYDLYKKVGETYLLIKDYNNALKWLNYAVDKPGLTEAWLVEVLKARAKAYYPIGNLQGCSDDLKQVMKLAPGDHGTISEFIELYDQQQRLDDAIQYLTNERVITDDNIGIITNIGFKYTDQNEFERAKFYFNVVLQRNAGDYLANRGMGIVQCLQGDYDAGRAFFVKTHEAFPKHPEPYTDMGLSFFYQQRMTEAIDNFLAALKIDPAYVEAAQGLARAYYESNYLNASREIYVQLLAIGTEKALYHYNLGVIDEGLGKKENAISDYTKAIRQNPAFEDVHVRLTKLLEQEPDRLRQIYRDLIDEKPEAGKYYRVYLGMVLEAQHFLEDAVLEYQSAIATDPDFVLAHYRLAETMVSLERIDVAIEEFKKSMELEPNNAGISCRLGYVYRHIGRYDDAITLFNRGISLDPQLERNYVGLGGVYFRKAEYLLAIPVYQRALSLNVNNRIARASLAACYRELQMTSECQAEIDLVRRHEKERADIVYSVYDSACIEALLGNRDAAFSLLRTALENQEISRVYAARDSDFYLFKETEEWKSLLGVEVV
jgi:tetratricopeptide (TPR) repeat protein